jgi:hypothetical protein
MILAEAALADALSAGPLEVKRGGVEKDQVLKLADQLSSSKKLQI